MAAALKNLYVEQGSTFTLGFNWHKAGPVVNGVVTAGDPYDLTGCTARMQIRRKQGDPVLFEATSAPPVNAAAVDAGAGRIRLGGATGRVEIELTDEDTDIIAARSAFYDLEIEWPLPTRQTTSVSITNGSAILTGVASQFTPEDLGFRVTGSAAVPADTVIISVSANGSTATMSSPATADDAAATLTLTSPLRPRVDRLLQGTLSTDPNITQTVSDPVVT